MMFKSQYLTSLSQIHIGKEWQLWLDIGFVIWYYMYTRSTRTKPRESFMFYCQDWNLQHYYSYMLNKYQINDIGSKTIALGMCRTNYLLN